ncbi:MAG: glycosyltransferase family 1 protein [Bacteroidia bacterium]|nr:glycosyltransferase family 1 protein [Bacteroidia bacterium]
MPFPPAYGGVIDIFYKIEALKELGTKIILHVFLYDGKEPSKKLDALCHKIYYYKRKRFANPFSGELPYIVSTRNDDELLLNLKKDQHPILFEGLHTTYFLGHEDLKKRWKIVRTHNVEHLYYKALEEAETGFFKKYFFRVESERLLKYEGALQHADVIAAISPQETVYYSGLFPQTQYIPAFHSNNNQKCQTGRGKFVLYHGNLGVGENNKAALYLVHEVFKDLDIPVVIAGNNPSKQLQQAIKANSYISLANHINSDDILELVREAHINTLVTFQSTGIKLKLLNSLFLGRHCLVNSAMVENTGLEGLCHMADKAADMQAKIKELWNKDFTKEDIEHRCSVLSTDFDNLNNAKRILTAMEKQVAANYL